MTTYLRVLEAGPGSSVQDFGWRGQMQYGLSRGGAADPLAILEGNALLRQPTGTAAIELSGFGGVFQTTAPTRIALTGADMSAKIDGDPLVWNASHLLQPGQTLKLGAARYGSYGYLHLGGGIDTPPFQGSRSTHAPSGIGSVLQPGAELPLGKDQADGIMGRVLPVDDRFQGGNLRILPSVQTDKFTPETLVRFQSTSFARTPRGNRQGVELGFDGAPFAIEDQLNILSEIILPGDVQMTGDGRPFILLADCQTTGGYPRIGTVFPSDLPKAAQATPGSGISFEFIDFASARSSYLGIEAQRKKLESNLRPLIRDPHDMTDLLGYQLISGMTTGEDNDD